MEDELRRRVRVFMMSMTYQQWWDSFKNPSNYKPELYRKLELEDDFTLTFGYRGSSVKVPIIMFCSLSSKLQQLLLSKPRRGLNICLKGEHGYPYYWLRNFLEHNMPLPPAEGTMQVMMMAFKYDLKGVLKMCREKLSFYLTIDSFPYVFNASIETQDRLLLEECGPMVAAWTDQLLSLPNLSVLGKEAMLDLLNHQQLNPSSELIVFNAIMNWWRNRGRKTLDDLCFLDDLRTVLGWVRFLLMSENDINEHVVPSGVFPFEDVQTLIQMLRGDRDGVPSHGFYVYNPVLQSTPRPKLLRVAVCGARLSDLTLPEVRLVHDDDQWERWIASFTVDKLCYIRRISSASVLDEGSATLRVFNKRGFSITSKWVHASSCFDRPVALLPHVIYDFVVHSRTLRSDKECCETMKKTVGGVTLEGLRFCTYLTVEFATTKVECESESGSDSSEAENSGGSSSGDSIEVLTEAEIKMAKLQVSAQQQRRTARQGPKEQKNGKQTNRERLQAAAAKEEEAEEYVGGLMTRYDAKTMQVMITDAANN